MKEELERLTPSYLPDFEVMTTASVVNIVQRDSNDVNNVPATSTFELCYTMLADGNGGDQIARFPGQFASYLEVDTHRLAFEDRLQAAGIPIVDNSLEVPTLLRAPPTETKSSSNAAAIVVLCVARWVSYDSDPYRFGYRQPHNIQHQQQLSSRATATAADIMSTSATAAEQQQTGNEMKELKQKIEKVEKQIEEVEKQIKKVEKEIEKETDAEEKKALRDEKKQLRKEKEQLRDEKKQLNDRLNMLLQQQQQLRELKVQGRPPLHPQTTTNKDVELDRKISMILEKLSLDRATPQYSPALVGRQEKDRLLSEGLFKVFVGKEGEESVLSADQVAKLATARNEHQVVAYLTPHLEALVRGIETVNYSVFNSEEYKWVVTNTETPVYNEKPDLIICDPAIIEAKPPFKITDDAVLQQMRTKTSKYGVLSQWKLRDFIGITCEAKQKIDNKGFGEVINYGAHLCYGEHGSQTTRLLLFDTTMFWLVHVVKGKVGFVETCKWLDPGSKNLLRDFIRQPALPKLLLEARQGLRLTVESDSFLGAGAFGFVFRAVRGDDGRHVALKLVLGEGESVVRLETEANSMRKASEKCPHEVMGVEKEGFVKYHNGAVLLMSRIGEGYPKLNPQHIVDSLRTLHKNHIIHGDARLENVVCIDGKPCWIDFMDSRFLSAPLGMQLELKALVDSVREKFGFNAE